MKGGLYAKKPCYGLEIHRSTHLLGITDVTNTLLPPKRCKKASLSFFFSFFKDLLQIVLGFTAVKPERQVWSVTRELSQQAAELGLSRFSRLNAILVIRLPLQLPIFLDFGGTVFCVSAKLKLKFPMTLMCFTKPNL